MIHSVDLRDGRRTVEINFYCDHPDMKNNLCPALDGDCATCQYSAIKMRGDEFYRLYCIAMQEVNDRNEK